MQRQAKVMACRRGHYTLTEIGKQFGVSHATLSHAVKKFKGGV